MLSALQFRFVWATALAALGFLVFSVATLGATSTPTQATPAQGVSFVDQNPLTIEGDKGTQRTVEVFNGSPEGQTLRLRIDGSTADVLRVENASTAVGAGEIATFTLTLGKAPSAVVAAQLVTHSTDGTLARTPIAIGPTDADAAASAKSGYPTSLDYGVVNTGKSPSVTVSHMPGDETKPAQVGIVSGAGRAIAVTRTGDTLTLAEIAEPGEYKGTVDLTPGTDGGDVAITAKARKGGVAAIFVLLLVGLLVAYLLEAFLVVHRPRWVLRRRLDGLKRDASLRQTQLTEELQRLIKELNKTKTWQAPVIYDPSEDASLVQRRADLITTSLRNAVTDAQRDRWGPDGAEVTALEKDMTAYAALASALAQLGRRWVGFVKSARDEERDAVAAASLAKDVDEHLVRSVLEESQMETEQELVKGTTKLLDGLRGLYDGLSGVQYDAEAKQLTDIAASIAAKRGQLLHSFTTDSDADTFQRALDEFEQVVYGTTSARKKKLSAGRLEPAIATSQAQTQRDAHHQRALDLTLANTTGRPAMPLLPLPEDPNAKQLSLMDNAFVVLSALLAAASGMVTLYYGDDTFGAPGDYLGLVVWGSTVAGGLTFVRRLVPGAVKTIAS